MGWNLEAHINSTIAGAPRLLRPPGFLDVSYGRLRAFEVEFDSASNNANRMANTTHVKLIKEGTATWNAWRIENPDIAPDLSIADLSQATLLDADLRGANLSEANLSKAYLLDANLSDANLSKACLCEANLGRADLNGANLSGANLTGANLNRVCLLNADLSGASLSGVNLVFAYLQMTDFSGADLRGADLSWANLDGANLSGADLSEAHLLGTLFGSNDLSAIQGLEAVIHEGPSTIGIDTLYRSAGNIPAAFLRGVGVPEDFMTFLPSLVQSAIEFYSCFISYSHQDEEFSRRLYSWMRSEKLRVWYAPEDMKGGRKLYEEIFRAIQVYDKLLLVLSEHSMKSEWVTTEIRRARRAERDENRRKLFPIRLVNFDALQTWECFDADSGKDLAVELREYYIPDFSNWKDNHAFEREFAKLLRDLKAEEG
jgi:uncharacterized protein YjbI with pentapeptide repeats